MSSQNDISLVHKLKLVLIGFVVSCGGSFHFGYQISIINPMADVIQGFLGRSIENRLHHHLRIWTQKLLWPTVAGLLFVGAFLGAVLSPKLLHRYGMKPVLHLSTLLLVISFSLAYISKIVNLAEIFIIHRLLVGIGIGMITTAQTVYLTEVSPMKYRGFMGTMTGFSTSIGFVLASGIGLPQVLGQDHLWHYAYMIEILPSAILTLSLLLFLPTSPVEALKKGNAKEALICLETFCDKGTAFNQLAQMEQEITVTEESSTTVPLKTLCREAGNVLFISLLLNATVSFSGITAASFFGTFLLQNIGFNNNEAALANCLASLSGILGNVIGSFTIDRVGRRRLIIGCLSLLALLNTILMGCVFFFQITDDNNVGYAFLGIFMIFLFIFSLGVGPVAWFIATELSPASFRPQIQSLSVSCQYITCFISSIVFLPLYQLVGPLSFLIFITPLTLCSVYLFFYLPESKNRSPEALFMDLKKTKEKTFG
ncbi:unnamed protein product [Bursaphelenchus okinawaensis]|uniref:Major facilitator superfamily (MFS) profile domain-containing protein n=1 Tax=Bursaphelenchus okinawaensis TaxID=465554 RepID=A0A811L9R4_9BILA|nr:unnamed protein product [Bursaphelenchus okinawaensis]CAG9120362.1 unnamed protein product [Bursaphelenchus okinawaensis]